MPVSMLKEILFRCKTESLIRGVVQSRLWSEKILSVWLIGQWVLLLTNLFHPIHHFSVKVFLDGDV